MARRNIVLELDDELTPEGKELWNNISDYQKIMEGVTILPEPPKIEIIESELQRDHLRTELRKMIENSKRVIRECENIIRQYKTKEEYLSSDAKVAKTLHENLVSRLTKILEYKEAFDFLIVVDNEGPNKLYIDTTRRNAKD